MIMGIPMKGAISGACIMQLAVGLRTLDMAMINA